MSRVHTPPTMKKTALLLLLTGMAFAVPTTSFAQGGNNRQNQNQNQNDEEEDDEEKEDEEEEESNAKEGIGSKRFWQATLPSGDYMVAIDRISSISMHQYVLDGQLVVNEMVVDTNGRAIARFYHVVTTTEAAAGSTSAGKAVERGRQLLDQAGQRVGTDIHNLAQKNYPTTSHAGMVEYRIINLNDLKALYKSLQSAWESNSGKTITIK